MISDDEAAHAISEAHAASETNLNIPLVSSQGAGDAVGGKQPPNRPRRIARPQSRLQMLPHKERPR